MNHTREPWEFDGCTVYKTNEACNNNIFFTNVQGGFYQTYDVHTPRDELAANARRICLCINALAGIPDEALEAGVVEMLAAALTELADDLERRRAEKDKGARNYLGEIVHQRDRDALAAMGEQLSRARAAIALLQKPQP